MAAVSFEKSVIILFDLQPRGAIVSLIVPFRLMCLPIMTPLQVVIVC
jgi:hypothetical protein